MVERKQKKTLKKKQKQSHSLIKIDTSKKNNSIVKKYDIIVVGGGISGLTTAYRLQTHYPNKRILVLEASSVLGGRLQTIQHQGTHYEAGGARFNNTQHRVIKLLKHLDLSDGKIPITSDTYYKSYPKDKHKDIPYLNRLMSSDGLINFDPILNEIRSLKQSGHISHQDMVHHSILDLVDKKLGHKYKNIKQVLENVYEYWSELAVMNSVDALKLFKNDFNKKIQYYLLKSGLSSIITELSKRIKKKGGHIITSSYLESIRFVGNSDMKHIDAKHIDTNTSKHYILNVLQNYQTPIQYQCHHLVLAIQQKDLLKLKCLTKEPSIKKMLNSVSPQPLYRIYAKYPIKDGKSWFHNMPKIATHLHLKFIIPYDYDKGLIMITYTDGKYANYWNKKLSESEESFMKQLNLELSQLFPEKEIPDPLWVKHHYWSSGSAYWKTGVESHQIIPNMIVPFGKKENIYICGENFSNHQAWMEGALQTSELVTDALTSRLLKESKKRDSKERGKKSVKQSGGGNTKKSKKVKKTKQVKLYSMNEVKQHNKKSDAWLVIRKKVYNVTSWIDKHPGGMIIMKGVGKDATSLFNSIGHSEDAKQILKKYFIGLLKTH